MPRELGGWLLDNFSDPNFDMSKQLTDCYFYFYSKCTRSDCPYRHEPAALGHELICNRWLEDNCFDKHCKNRHCHINRQRTTIPCYFENTASGCLKPHCVFQHSKPRNNNTCGQPNRNNFENFNDPRNDPNAIEEHSVAGAIGGGVESKLDTLLITEYFPNSGNSVQCTESVFVERSNEIKGNPENVQVPEKTAGKAPDHSLDSSGIHSMCEEELTTTQTAST